MRRWLVSGLAAVVAAGIFACTGDDPALVTTNPSLDGSVALTADAATDAVTGDAATGDAALVLPLVATFGERPDALVKDVTTDTELHQLVAEQSLNYGALGNLDLDSDVGAEKVALIRFDLSVVPPTRKLNKATLKLWTSGDQGCEASGATTVSVFRVLESWDEGSAFGDAGVANYVQRKAGAPWQTAGVSGSSREATAAGSFAPTALASEFEVDLTALVATWLANPGVNLGMVLTTAGTGDGICFLSSEAPLADRRPLLTIAFTN